MFVTVKYGEKEELKVNPNCYTRIIHDYIRSKLNIPTETEFDLCTEEGERCHILDHPPNTNAAAHGILPPRQTFRVLMLHERTSENETLSGTSNTRSKTSSETPGEVLVHEEGESHTGHTTP
uniref:RBD domain-containing protein n=1 Tax=Cuerna arida TaxID=1464854 RepID=A0A1B6GJB0_9HEMI